MPSVLNTLSFAEILIIIVKVEQRHNAITMYNYRVYNFFSLF